MRKRIRTTNSMSKEAHSYLVKLASRLNVDLREFDVDATRKVLSKGKPSSAIIKETWER